MHTDQHTHDLGPGFGFLHVPLQLCVPQAARGKLPPITESANRCDVSALDKFADTRAKFSQEASGGNMVEAIVDIRGVYEAHLKAQHVQLGDCAQCTDLLPVS